MFKPWVAVHGWVTRIVFILLDSDLWLVGIVIFSSNLADCGVPTWYGILVFLFWSRPWYGTGTNSGSLRHKDGKESGIKMAQAENLFWHEGWQVSDQE